MNSVPIAIDNGSYSINETAEDSQKWSLSTQYVRAKYSGNLHLISSNSAYIYLYFMSEINGGESPSNQGLIFSFTILINGITYTSENMTNWDQYGVVNQDNYLRRYTDRTFVIDYSQQINTIRIITTVQAKISGGKIATLSSDIYFRPIRMDSTLPITISDGFAPRLYDNNGNGFTSQAVGVLPESPIQNSVYYIKTLNIPMRIYSTNASIENAIYRVSPSGRNINALIIPVWAAITITYDSTSWRILSYYDGSLNNWANKTTTVTYTPISQPISIANISGAHKYFSLPDPAATTTPSILTVIHAGGNNANYLYINRGAYTLDSNTNVDVYIKPDNANWNACIRFITDKVNWYILDFFYAPASWYSMNTTGTLTTSRNMNPSKNIIYINSYSYEYDNGGSNNMTSINLTNLATNRADIFYIKDIQNTAYAHSIVLKSSTAMFGTGDRRLAYNNTPKKMSGLIIASVNNGSVTNHYVVGSYLGY